MSSQLARSQEKSETNKNKKNGFRAQDNTQAEGKGTHLRLKHEHTCSHRRTSVRASQLLSAGLDERK